MYHESQTTGYSLNPRTISSSSTGSNAVSRRAVPSSLVGRLFEEYDQAALVFCLSSRPLLPCLAFDVCGVTGVYTKHRRSHSFDSDLTLELRIRDEEIAVATVHGLVNTADDTCLSL
jgi:hypothetical protein